jgi:hypothetical protein
MGGSLGRLSSRVGANQDIQDFNKMTVNDLYGKALQGWQTKRQSMMDMYNMAMQGEAAARAARAAGGFGGFGGLDGTGGPSNNVLANTKSAYGEITQPANQENLWDMATRAAGALYDYSTNPIDFGKEGLVPLITPLSLPRFGATALNALGIRNRTNTGRAMR